MKNTNTYVTMYSADNNKRTNTTFPSVKLIHLHYWIRSPATDIFIQFEQIYLPVTFLSIFENYSGYDYTTNKERINRGEIYAILKLF